MAKRPIVVDKQDPALRKCCDVMITSPWGHGCTGPIDSKRGD